MGLYYFKEIYTLHYIHEIRRITADFLKVVCIDVEEEPMLQEITGEVFRNKTAKIEKDARLDITARGFWTRGQKVFCDVRVFNPLAKCHRQKTLKNVTRYRRRRRKRNTRQESLK